jgi:DNA-binding LytR/AlgR family response regulator
MTAPAYFFIRNGVKNIRLDLDQIVYIEARRNYTRLVTSVRSYMVLAPLKDWLASLPAESFCQIHRAFIVAISQIQSFGIRSVIANGQEIPVGLTFKDALTKKVVIIGEETANPALPAKPQKPHAHIKTHSLS